MTTPEFTNAAWFTSSYSSSNGGECVEVALTAHAVGVRDSKDRDGGLLRLTPTAWHSLLARTRMTSARSPAIIGT